MRIKLRFSAVLQPQRTAGNRKYTARWTARFRDLPHVPRVLAEKLNMFNFSARIPRKRRKAVKRKETAKTVKEAYWPQVKRKPSARQPQPSADQKYFRLSCCPNCAILSNHFLTHNLLCLFIFRLSIAASSASFCLFVLTMTIAAPAIRARSSTAPWHIAVLVLLLCGNSVETSSDCSHCVLFNFSCCLQFTNDSKKQHWSVLQPPRFCTVAQTADFRGLPQYQNRLHTVWEPSIT